MLNTQRNLCILMFSAVKLLHQRSFGAENRQPAAHVKGSTSSA